MSDSVQPHRRQPTRLLRPWDSPGKNTGVGCHFLLQCVKVKSESEVWLGRVKWKGNNPARNKDTWIGRPCLMHLQIMRGSERSFGANLFVPPSSKKTHPRSQSRHEEGCFLSTHSVGIKVTALAVNTLTMWGRQRSLSCGLQNATA